MTKIPDRLIRKLTCVLALAAVLVISFVSPSYAAPDECVAVTTNNTNKYTLIRSAESQGGTKFRRGNRWRPGINISTLGVIPEFDNDYFRWNESVGEWWRSNVIAIGSKEKHFYKNPSSNLWFDGDEIEWQQADGTNCTE